MAKLRLLDMHALPVRLVCYRSFTVGIKVSSILGRAAADVFGILRTEFPTVK